MSLTLRTISREQHLYVFVLCKSQLCLSTPLAIHPAVNGDNGFFAP